MTMPISSSVCYTDSFMKEQKSHGSAFFGVACYYTVFPENVIPWHWHMELELIWIEKGQLDLLAGSRKFTLKEGEGAFVNGDVLHSVKVHGEQSAGKGKTIVRSIVFHPRLIGGTKDSVY
jgi:uncharacterized cupin superfamily protein